MEMIKQSRIFVGSTDREILYQETQYADVWMYSNYRCGLNLLHLRLTRSTVSLNGISISCTITNTFLTEKKSWQGRGLV
jgi:hypothetical protein